MDSQQKKQTPNKSQVMYDPMIIPRVKQYLEENVHQRYLDVGVMSRMLQERYREYSRRKSAPFRQLVEQAYKTVLHSYGLDSNPSSENDDDVGSDLEVMEEPQRPDPMNSMLTSMYMNSGGSGGGGGGGKQQAALLAAAASAAAAAGGSAATAGGSQDAGVAIDISSDEEDGDGGGDGKAVAAAKTTADLTKVVNPLISVLPTSVASPAKQSAEAAHTAATAAATAAATVAGGVAALLASTGSISIPAAKKRKIHQDAAANSCSNSSTSTASANVAVALAAAQLEAMLNAQNAAANNPNSLLSSGKPGGNIKLQLRGETRSSASPVNSANNAHNSNQQQQRGGSAPAVNGGPASAIAAIATGGGGGGGKSSSTGSNGGLRKPKCKFQITESALTFDDVGGMDRILKELCELLLHIKHPEVYRHIGLPPPRGFLLHGPPGCGKTLLAQAIAGQLDVLLIQVAATELVGGVSGESEERIRDLFEQAAAVAPCVLFIDEIDAISSNRQNAQKDMERRIVAQLLQSLDGLARHPHGDQVLIIGATNRADTIDPSLRRVGRFDQEISLGIPDRSAREHILRVICADLRLTQPFDFDWIAALTPGYVGADLLALATRAASIAVKRAFSAKAAGQLRRKSARRAAEARAASGEVVATVNLLDDTVVEEGAVEKAAVAVTAVEEEEQVEEKKEEKVAVDAEAASEMAVDDESAAVAVVESADAATAEKAAAEVPAVEAEVAAAVNGEAAAAKAATETEEPMDTDEATTAAVEEKTADAKETVTAETATKTDEVKTAENETAKAAQEVAAKTADDEATEATTTPAAAMETDVSAEDKPTELAAPVVVETTTATSAPTEESSAPVAEAAAPAVAHKSATVVNVDDIVDLSDDETATTTTTTANAAVAATATASQQSLQLAATDSTVRLALTLDEMICWLSTEEPIIEASEIRELAITMTDFCAAVKVVQPSAKREGFITVPDVTWADIGALHAIREELQLAVLAPVRFPRKLEALGLKSPSGVLLCGPPGCGKTLLAKAVANEAGINFISVKGPELLNMYVGESERAVRQCFQRARNSAPCVIFFDEFDALCPTRSGSAENTSSSRVVNQLLTEMDGVEERKGVFLMAATNRPDIVDPAVMRPGRLDKILYVGLPGELERAEILEALTKSKPRLAEDVSHVELAALTENFTGADLAGLVRQAALQALRASIAAALAEPAGPRAAAAGGEDAEADAEAAAAEEPICVRREHFLRALTLIRPSVSEEDKRHYLRLQKKYTVMPPTAKTTATTSEPTQ